MGVTGTNMPPKGPVDPLEKKFIYMKCVGGEIAAAAALAPRCAPVGLAPKKVGEDIQKATKEWKGIKVYVEIMVQNRLLPSPLCRLPPLSSSRPSKSPHGTARRRRTEFTTVSSPWSRSS